MAMAAPTFDHDAPPSPSDGGPPSGEAHDPTTQAPQARLIPEAAAAGHHSLGAQMTRLNGAFTAFATGLTPSDADLAAVEAAKAHATQLVTHAWEAQGSLLLGPLSRGTSLKPIGTIPLAVLLPKPWYHRHVNRMVPDRLPRILAELQQRLPKNAGDEPVSCEEDALYVRISGMEVALIPTFATDEDTLLLPDALLGDWRPCALNQQISLMEEKDDTLGGLARPLARLMHAWVAHHGLKIHPLHLEIMSLSAVSRPPQHLAEGVLSILQKMPRAIHDPCPDPGNPDHSLDLYLRDGAARARIADAAFIDARTMAQAIDAATRGDGWASALVREVFGSSFKARSRSRPNGG